MEEISLEETNKIRRGLGLAPISRPSSGLSQSVDAKASATSASNAGSDDAASISVEETNKIRAQLGLSLIPVSNGSDKSSETSETLENNEHENWLELKDQERRIKEQERIRKKVLEVKEKAERRKQLDNEKSIAEQDDDADSKSWLKKFRQKKKNSLGTVNYEEEREEERQQQQTYDSENLKGLKLAHKLSEVGALKSGAILTLKDKSVLGDAGSDSEPDELVSADLVEKKKLEDNLDAKKGTSKFLGDLDRVSRDSEDAGDDSDEFVVLNGSSIQTKPRPSRNRASEADQLSNKRMKSSIDFESISTDEVSSDYQQAPVKFKRFKVKKGSSAPKRRRLDGEGDDGYVVEKDDDEELQNVLVSARRKVLMSGNRKKPLTAEELAEKLARSKDTADETSSTDGVVVSTTTDFLGIVRQAKDDDGSSEPIDVRNRTDVDVDVSANGIPKEQDTAIPDAEADDEMPVIDSGSNDIQMTEDPTGAGQQELPTDRPEFTEDQDLSVSGGLADALKLIQSKGVTKKPDQNEEETAQVKARQEWMKKLEKRRAEFILDFNRRKLEAREDAKFDRLSMKEKETILEFEKEQFEKEWASVSQKVFADYKPNIKIEYRDDEGNVLSTKDAYKHMSHQFHGNKSGKKKVEKQLKKQAEEKRKEAQSIFEVSTADTKDRKNPGIRLQ